MLLCVGKFVIDGVCCSKNAPPTSGVVVGTMGCDVEVSSGVMAGGSVVVGRFRSMRLSDVFELVSSG